MRIEIVSVGELFNVCVVDVGAFLLSLVNVQFVDLLCLLYYFFVVFSSLFFSIFGNCFETHR